jgi:hypothetical protein
MAIKVLGDLDVSGDMNLTASDVPNLAASKITSGTFGTARIPSLSATKITSGTLGTAQIPSLGADKITSGQFGADRIPSLNASKITAGTLDDARIPNLNASKITNGTLADARIASASNWNTAYGWGNHASAGYLTSHPNISASTSSNNSGRTYIQDITLDSNGHVTGIATATETVTDTTYSAFTGEEEGLVPNGSGYGSDVYLDGDGQWTSPTNTTYSAGSGLDLSGTSFSVEADLRDGITHIGVSTSNYITFDNTNNRINFYAGGVFVARLESDGDLHVKGDVIAVSSIF